VQVAREWANPNLTRFEQKARKVDQQFREQEMEKKRFPEGRVVAGCSSDRPTVTESQR